MADAIVTGLASELVVKLFSLASEEVIHAWNLHQDLVTLTERLETIDALLSDANTKKLTMSAVHNWFDKLEVVARVADVFMDELAYEVTRTKVENHPKKVLNFFIPSKNSLVYRFKVSHKIKSMHTMFDNIFKSAGDLGLQPVAHLSSIVQMREIRKTPPFEDKSLVVGRDDDISYLVQTLCENCEEDLKVVAVVGMGGQGKTTLARMVYNKDVVDDMFLKKMWVTVSDDFDFTKILNEMVVSLSSNTSALENTEGLIKTLQEHLKGVKFLLVLDDVWNDIQEKWDNLINSLLGIGAVKGSSILVTTRNQEVADAMRCSASYQVEKLSEEDSWALFKQRAFSHGGVIETEAFATLGKRMVARCSGLPLAIKTLGGSLHSKKSEQEWLMIQNSDIWKSKGVLPSLRLSYDNLPYSSLKRCFAYFSIMPKDSHIYKDELVRTWMALGFLSPTKDSNVLLEDVGNEYFNILLWNSLLQDVERDEYGNITYCKMHDLVHDLALCVSSNYSSTITPSHDLNQNSKAMYVRFEGFKDVKPNSSKAYFDTIQALYTQASIFRVVLPNLKHLRVLVLTSYDKELPSSVENLKYLKLLDVSSSTGYNSYKLPDYITRLYNLQTLRISTIKELPKKVCNLINLRHLVVKKHADDFLSKRYMFIGIERLTFLQTLPHFVVSRDKKCLVGQLGGLKYLGGKLDLYGLSQVANMEEASEAKLSRKSNVQCLLLDWSNAEVEEKDREYNDEDVMEGLKPHENLKELTIEYFKGKKFASWITVLTSLVRVTLRNCNRCEGLPSLGHLSKLREIEIIGMNNVKSIRSNLYRSPDNGVSPPTVTTMYPSLTKLTLHGLSNLEEWVEPYMSVGHEDDYTVLNFPKLEVLDIESCSKLTLETLSRKVSSLTYLRLKNISDKGKEGSSNIDKLLKHNSPSLKTLSLDNCQSFTSLTLGIALEKLEVSSCPDLSNINAFKDSGGLKHLTIVRCPSLSELAFVQSMSSKLVKMILGPFSDELDEFPWPFSSSSVISFPNLTSLTLYGWKKLESILPAWLLDDLLSSTFPALTIFYIHDFEGIKSLPDSLAKLPSLERYMEMYELREFANYI